MEALAARIIMLEAELKINQSMSHIAPNKLKHKNKTGKIKSFCFTRFFFFILMFILLLFLNSCSENTLDKESLYREAVDLYNEGQYDKAIDRFNEALDASKGEVSQFQYGILKFRAECELRIGDYTSAENTYDALLKLDETSENQDYYNKILSDLNSLDEIKKANDLFILKDYEAAYSSFSILATLDGSQVGKIAWFNQAVCAEYLGDYFDAYTLFSSYVSKYPLDTAASKEMEFCRSRNEVENNQ